MAIGLFRTLVYSKAKGDLERRDELLDELRAFAQAHRDDTTVRQCLAKGLMNTLVCATEEHQLPRRC